MSTGRVALYLQDKHPIRDGMAYARYAEERGFEAVWQAESRLVREATVPMAAFAAVTERIKVGSGVVNTWTRNVGLLAATFSTLDDLAPGEGPDIWVAVTHMGVIRAVVAAALRWDFGEPPPVRLLPERLHRVRRRGDGVLQLVTLNEPLEP